MLMEPDKNFMPEIHLFPRLDKVCAFIGRLLNPFEQPEQFVPFEEEPLWTDTSATKKF